MKAKGINVTSFVQTNITPTWATPRFLQGPTDRTKHIWNLCLKALEGAPANGVRSLDNKTVSTITSHKAGYIDKEQELIVGLQTDQLLKRAIISPSGGINVVSRACKENGVDVDEKVKDIFTHYRKTLTTTACSTSTPREIRSFPFAGLPDGTADNYARGRIIGDYRRLALYGTDRLIEAKTEDLRLRADPDDRRPHPPARRGRRSRSKH